MKLKINFLLIFLITIYFVSCKKIPTREMLEGRWKMDSAMIYYKGKETMYVPTLDENNFAGTIYNFSINEFNNYGEFVSYRLNDYQNRLIWSYNLIENDSKIRLVHGSQEKGDFNEISIKILKLSENKLITTWDFNEANSTKSVHTYYYTKIKPLIINTDLIVGEWKVVYNISYVKENNGPSEKIKLDTTTYGQMFVFDKLSFQLKYLNKSGSIIKDSYQIKNDSLIIPNWSSFYILKLNNDELIITANSGMELNGDNPGNISYIVKVAKKIK
jgi:hypothetical protein